MDNIKNIFERMDIRQIRSFLLTGEEEREPDDRSYQERIWEKDERMFKELNKRLPNGEWRDEVFSVIYESFSIREEIYTEIGMTAGVKLFNPPGRYNSCCSACR